MHLRVPRPLPVLRRTRRGDDARVHDRPSPEPMPQRRQVRVDLREQRLAETVALQQVPEVQDRRLVRQRTRQPQTGETPHRLHFVQQILHPRVAQVVEQLHAVNAQHRRQPIRPPPASSLRIERLDALRQTLPRNQLVHPRQKLLAPRTPLLRVVFQLRKRRLIHPHPLAAPTIRPLSQRGLVQTFLRGAGRQRARTTKNVSHDGPPAALAPGPVGGTARRGRLAGPGGGRPGHRVRLPVPRRVDGRRAGRCGGTRSDLRRAEPSGDRERGGQAERVRPGAEDVLRAGHTGRVRGAVRRPDSGDGRPVPRAAHGVRPTAPGAADRRRSVGESRGNARVRHQCAGMASARGPCTLAGGGRTRRPHRVRRPADGHRRRRRGATSTNSSRVLR